MRFREWLFGPREAEEDLSDNAVFVYYQKCYEECLPYLKDGERPAECIDRNRAEVNALLRCYSDALYKQSQAEKEIERLEQEISDLQAVLAKYRQA